MHLVNIANLIYSTHFTHLGLWKNHSFQKSHFHY